MTELLSQNNTVFLSKEMFERVQLQFIVLIHCILHVQPVMMLLIAVVHFLVVLVGRLKLNIMVLWLAMVCSLVDRCQPFGGSSCLHLQVRKLLLYPEDSSEVILMYQTLKRLSGYNWIKMDFVSGGLNLGVQLPESYFIIPYMKKKRRKKNIKL